MEDKVSFRLGSLRENLLLLASVRVGPVGLKIGDVLGFIIL